jgi:hypothetical protein
VSDQFWRATSTTVDISDEDLKREFCLMTQSGETSARDAVAALAQRHNVPRQRVYRAIRP